MKPCLQNMEHLCWSRQRANLFLRPALAEPPVCVIGVWRFGKSAWMKSLDSPQLLATSCRPTIYIVPSVPYTSSHQPHIHRPISPLGPLQLLDKWCRHFTFWANTTLISPLHSMRQHCVSSRLGATLRFITSLHETALRIVTSLHGATLRFVTSLSGISWRLITVILRATTGVAQQQ